MLRTSDLPIQDVAALLGISVDSIRRWEAAGVIPFRVRRTTLGWRRYSTDEIEKLRALCDERCASMKRNQQPR
jgi:DNA-binding transcriptional MerR regulator